MTRTVVVGLDGASWRLVEPWIKDGTLPNFAAFRDDGVWAESESCLPPVTFPNWKCYSSGKDPGGFGVYWFERIRLAEERIEIMNRTDFDTAELWDYLNEAGYTTGVVNMPTMYPPRDLDGFVVCGGPDAVDGEYRTIDTGYTSPEGLETELESRYDYRVHPSPMLSSNGERGAEVDEILDLLDLRLQVAYDLFKEKEMDFVHVTLFYLNVLQHFFWNDDPTKRAWELIDDWIGRLEALEDTNVILMSDHGCAPTTTEFYINEWLAENGYLTKRRTVEDSFQRVGLTRENALTTAKRLGIVNALAKTVPERIQQLVPQEAGAKRERKLEKVDLTDTQAVASGQGPIYIHPDADVDQVTEDLLNDLSTVTDDGDEPLFDSVYYAEEVYTGPYATCGPAIVVDMRPGVHVNDGLGGGETQTQPDRWAAENSRYGIFAAKGPDIDKLGKIGKTRITDIAPTVLAGFDVDIPTDMVGEQLPIFTHSPDVGEQEPISPDAVSNERYNEVADRLKQLGYME
jgi:predicted AlkP superfamily phosphohydrolase/phosphomutase